EPEKIELQIEVADIYLDMDTLVSLGLIINEIVSNTLKHAFADHESGKLRISLDQDAEKYHLEISDDGTGLDDLTKLEQSASFGLKMVKAFVKKLNGTLKLLPSEGTTFQIEFIA
ncbi:MAG: sensor histidine kinase, partial [Bacteroidota bacterium]